MDRAVFDRMASEEGRHWWFVGRREIIRALIEREVAPPGGARILEAGCGTGGNLELLHTFGRVDAFESDPEARLIASQKPFAAVSQGSLPHSVAQPDSAYHLIGLFDVLEHIEEDTASLATLGRKLKPGGALLITVPAMPWLWSGHDVRHHHKRRYTPRSLVRAATGAGLRVERIGYFNSLLFPLAVAERFLTKVLRRPSRNEEMPPPFINTALGAVFRLERHLVGRWPVPWGLSLFAVVRRAA